MHYEGGRDCQPLGQADRKGKKKRRELVARMEEIVETGS